MSIVKCQWYSGYGCVSACVCSLQSRLTRVSACHETAAVPAAETKLCNTEIYCCISRSHNTPRRSKQDECYGAGNCFWLCVVPVCLFTAVFGCSFHCGVKMIFQIRNLNVLCILTKFYLMWLKQIWFSCLGCMGPLLLLSCHNHQMLLVSVMWLAGKVVCELAF